MKRNQISLKILLNIVIILTCTIQVGYGLTPPSQKQITSYKKDGSFEKRKSRAFKFKNHIMSPKFIQKQAALKGMEYTLPSGIMQPMPSVGHVKMLVLLIDFSDHPATRTKGQMEAIISGHGGNYPYDSLKHFYARASYNKLNLDATVLGWYRPKYPRSNISQNTSGRENLIKEALKYYDEQGHDFSQYDNNHDGYVDYLAVYWTGPDNGWGNFWWGYSTGFSEDGPALDNVRFARYTWQWESKSPKVLIHETGHALGLPDLYDYNSNIGPLGGVGGLDIMDGVQGDFNPYFKWLLDWTTPKILSFGTQKITLNASGSTEQNNSVILWKDANLDNPFSEFFIVQNRWKTHNDVDYLTNGLLIWHIDGRLNKENTWRFNNSNTSHKFIRLMEADGLEEIEQNYWVDRGDYYKEGDSFSDITNPNSKKYNGTKSGISLSNISINSKNETISFIATAGKSKPDFKPVLKAYGTIIHGAEGTVRMIISVGEYNGGITTDTLKITIPKNNHISLIFDNGKKEQAGKVVENQNWKMRETDSLYIFEYIGDNGVFPPKTLSRLGVDLHFTSPVSSKGRFELTVTVVKNSAEVNDRNNKDSEIIEYNSF